MAKKRSLRGKTARSPLFMSSKPQEFRNMFGDSLYSMVVDWIQHHKYTDLEIVKETEKVVRMIRPDYIEEGYQLTVSCNPGRGKHPIVRVFLKKIEISKGSDGGPGWVHLL